MDAPRTDPTAASLLIHEVGRLARRRFEDEARVHEITLPQWRALSEIQRQGRLSQVSLAGCLDADPMTVSGILERLEKRGLIERHPDPADSRAKLATVTPAGEELVAATRRVRLGLVESALDGVSEAERAALLSILGRIRDNLSGASAEQKESKE